MSADLARDILDGAFDAQLEGAIASREAALAWALEHHPPTRDSTRDG